jgi:hypothetical protein
VVASVGGGTSGTVATVAPVEEALVTGASIGGLRLLFLKRLLSFEGQNRNKVLFQGLIAAPTIRLAHKFCTVFVHQQRMGAHKVELLVHGGVDAEFYGASFGNKT